MKHKSDDYKISDVKYYLKNKDNIRKTCKIFDCSKTSLQRWIDRYKTTKNITRKNRTPISYKINKDELRLIHGLLHCKNGCGSWNRDRNGSSNIYKIAKNAINNIDRPSYLCRETSNQSTSTSAYNQTLRRYEKT